MTIHSDIQGALGFPDVLFHAPLTLSILCVESTKFTSSLEMKFISLQQWLNFISRLDVNFLDSTQNIDKVSGA